jgi:transcriptional regulator with XRE-family HTH domain
VPFDFDREEFYREVGLRLQLARKRKGLNQDAVAQALGMPRASYANVEGGRQRTALDIVWKVAAYLGVPLDTIVPEAIPVVTSPSQSPELVTATAGTNYVSIKSAK